LGSNQDVVAGGEARGHWESVEEVVAEKQQRGAARAPAEEQLRVRRAGGGAASGWGAPAEEQHGRRRRSKAHAGASVEEEGVGALVNGVASPSRRRRNPVMENKGSGPHLAYFFSAREDTRQLREAEDGMRPIPRGNQIIFLF
jgi:hypothetical protein